MFALLVATYVQADSTGMCNLAAADDFKSSFNDSTNITGAKECNHDEIPGHCKFFEYEGYVELICITYFLTPAQKNICGLGVRKQHNETSDDDTITIVNNTELSERMIKNNTKVETAKVDEASTYAEERMCAIRKEHSHGDQKTFLVYKGLHANGSIDVQHLHVDDSGSTAAFSVSFLLFILCA